MTNKTLTLGSLFDGSGGFPLGGLLAGITPVWASEIEPFPIRVTTKRLPFMKHYGNISAMDGGKIEPVDIITFGSPCQDMSIAGRRDGLDGKRSSLFYEAVRIIKEMRCATDGRYPRYIVWENVPGAFSSNKGEDFKAVLEAVIGIAEPNTQVPMPEKARWPYADLYMGDGWSVAYRTLDAQYWGVPQRRRRIYLVADFAGRSAGKILFESEGVSWYSAAGFRSWQRAAGSFTPCVGATGFDGYNGSLTDDTSATLGVNCGMSTGRNGIVLNDQGGDRIDVTEEVISTLRAEAHHPPCVVESAGFCTEHSAKSRTIGYEEECSPTLRAGVVPAAVALENHPTDSRVKLSEDGNVQTLTSRMGTGGNNVPLVMKIRSGCEGGGKGPLIQENKSATLSCNNDQTLFEPRAYGICSKDSNAMKSDNPHSGIYEAETARTLDGNGGNPSCNQGGIAVVESYAIQGSMIGREDKNGSQGDGINEDVSFTLNTVDRHAVYAMTTGSYTQVEEETSPTIMARDYKDPNAVCYGIGRDTFNQGQNAKFAPAFEEDLQPTLVAKGPGAIQSGYTVRRLTPTECARLQGFPDNWCADLGTEKPSDEEMYFWHKVFKTYSEVTGCKMKSDKQVAKWLKDPYSDSAEYKMWGNGVALPCVWFVLCGIVWAEKIEAAD
ncbi:DNA cytosine methyltransferase [Ruminococcus bicirculans (ex Wegman et al. 2014)]|uniref:DNA (cytosine-5-)-methyltransferase n=1 Tax=Ruminococcus bicirculans (ex Wegman et al. 2014) TaxID=1160721 RepID=A0AAW6E6D2_9FIRM|nr:DNA cytosine methyltransferase [Ruminococcus bicirculans (ex Wegman et al. 2014)]MDB8742770.1 DNA cytosine methyltransferase [Ruminococcus bicirculans (ex Wegman et al. 2014)]